MINYSQALAYVIKPALEALGLAALQKLLAGTLAQESNGGTYISQLGGGPALGVFQMEPATHDDIWNRFLPHQPFLCSRMMTLCGFSAKPTVEMLRVNLLYSACMCAILYQWRLEQYKKSAPETTEQCAEVWKLCYNTVKGKGTVDQWIESYNKYAGTKAPKQTPK